MEIKTSKQITFKSESIRIMDDFQDLKKDCFVWFDKTKIFFRFLDLIVKRNTQIYSSLLNVNICTTSKHYRTVFAIDLLAHNNAEFNLNSCFKLCSPFIYLFIFRFMVCFV